MKRLRFHPFHRDGDSCVHLRWDGWVLARVLDTIMLAWVSVPN